MTNYNERLDEIVRSAYSGEVSWIHDQLDGTSVLEEALARNDNNMAATKQAITSLIKELVEEAKPKESICWDGTDVSHRFMECATCRANHIVEEYTNDLIERIK